MIFPHFADAIFPHFVWEKKLIGIQRNNFLPPKEMIQHGHN